MTSSSFVPVPPPLFIDYSTDGIPGIPPPRPEKLFWFSTYTSSEFSRLRTCCEVVLPGDDLFRGPVSFLPPFPLGSHVAQFEQKGEGTGGKASALIAHVYAWCYVMLVPITMHRRAQQQQQPVLPHSPPLRCHQITFLPSFLPSRSSSFNLLSHFISEKKLFIYSLIVSSPPAQSLAVLFFHSERVRTCPATK